MGLPESARGVLLAHEASGLLPPLARGISAARRSSDQKDTERRYHALHAPKVGEHGLHSGQVVLGLVDLVTSAFEQEALDFGGVHGRSPGQVPRAVGREVTAVAAEDATLARDVRGDVGPQRTCARG